MLKRAQAARLLAVGPPASAARLLILGRGEAVIGSADACALQIAEASVADRHAVISRRRGRYVVSDFKSAGGTFVNDKRARRTRTLKHRDTIRFGAETVYRFIDPDASMRLLHRKITGAVLVLMICAAGWAAHFMKWDGGLLSIATITDLVAWEQAHSTPNHALARAVSSAVAHPRVASAAKAPMGLQTPAAAGTAVPIAITSAHPPSPAPSESASLAPPWLERINHYRSMAGLATLHENRQLSASVAAHAHYLLVNFGTDIRSGNALDASAHSEDPGKSGYTHIGWTAAQNSQLAWGSGSLDPESQMDSWIAGPFHRLAMLNPFGTEAGFGEANADESWVAALRLPPPDAGKRYPHAIEFPPDGATVSLDWEGIESPDPLTSCDGYESPAGLPITLQLGRLYDTQLFASSLTQDGGKPVEHCAFDAHSYHNPNRTAQEYGRWALRSSGAVVLIPREPLTPGTQYSVSITAHGHTFAWKFKLAG